MSWPLPCVKGNLETFPHNSSVTLSFPFPQPSGRQKRRAFHSIVRFPVFSFMGFCTWLALITKRAKTRFERWNSGALNCWHNSINTARFLLSVVRGWAVIDLIVTTARLAIHIVRLHLNIPTILHCGPLAADTEQDQTMRSRQRGKVIPRFASGESG